MFFAGNTQPYQVPKKDTTSMEALANKK